MLYYIVKSLPGTQNLFYWEVNEIAIRYHANAIRCHCKAMKMIFVQKGSGDIFLYF